MTARTALDVCRWLQSLGLRPSCLLVAHAIGHRLGPNGEAWPSLSTLARDTGLGRATVKRCLNDLEGDGVITRTRTRRADGSHGANVYSFGAQWDLFRERGRASRGGVGSQRAYGRLTASLDKGTERDHLNGARDNARSVKGAGEREGCERTFDIEAYIERTEAARVEAARRGFGGPWDDVSVAGFLRGAEGRDA